MARRKVILSDIEIIKRLKISISDMDKIGGFNREIVRSYKKQLADKEKVIAEEKEKVREINDGNRK